MCPSGYALAIDAGVTFFTAATARIAAGGGIEVRPFGAGGGEGAASAATATEAVAFVRDDGEVLFGARARESGALQPDRLIRGFLQDVGNPVPLTAGGFAVTAEELVARLVAVFVTAAREREGALPQVVAVACPTEWGAHRTEALREALRAMGVGQVVIVPAAVAAAQSLGSRETDAAGTIAVYDLGASGFAASLLRDDAVLGTCRIAVGAADIDASLVRHVLATCPPASEDAPPADELSLHRSAVRAKEALSYASDAVMTLPRADGPANVRLTRAELEEIASASLADTLDALEQVLESSGIEETAVDAILLVGGGSRIPLVAQRLSERFDRPLVVPEHPQHAVALGGARLVAATLALPDEERTAAVSVATGQPAETTASRSPRRRVAVGGARRSLPYAAAAGLAAAAVLVAGGMVLGTTTRLGTATEAAKGAEPVADRDVDGFLLDRTASTGFTTAITPAGPEKADAGPGDTRDEVSAGRGPRVTPPTPELDAPPASRPAAPKPGGRPVVAPSDADASPAPVSEPDADPTPVSDAPPTEPAPDPTTEPDPATEPAPVETTVPVDTEPAPEASPEPAPEPPPSPAPEPDPAPESQPTAEPSPAPSGAPDPEPIA